MPCLLLDFVGAAVGDSIGSIGSGFLWVSVGKEEVDDRSLNGPGASWMWEPMRPSWIKENSGRRGDRDTIFLSRKKNGTSLSTSKDQFGVEWSDELVMESLG